MSIQETEYQPRAAATVQHELPNLVPERQSINKRQVVAGAVIALVGIVMLDIGSFRTETGHMYSVTLWWLSWAFIGAGYVWGTRAIVRGMR